MRMPMQGDPMKISQSLGTPCITKLKLFSSILWASLSQLRNIHVIVLVDTAALSAFFLWSGLCNGCVGTLPPPPPAKKLGRSIHAYSPHPLLAILRFNKTRLITHNEAEASFESHLYPLADWHISIFQSLTLRNRIGWSHHNATPMARPGARPLARGVACVM